MKVKKVNFLWREKLQEHLKKEIETQSFQAVTKEPFQSYWFKGFWHYLRFNRKIIYSKDYQIYRDTQQLLLKRVEDEVIPHKLEIVRNMYNKDLNKLHLGTEFEKIKYYCRAGLITDVIGCRWSFTKTWLFKKEGHKLSV